MNFNIDKVIDKEFERCIRRVYNADLDRIKLVQQSIRHPHFYYAVYNMETGEVKYVRKKWYQWFSGKRVVHIKIRSVMSKGLPDYYKMED